MAEFSLMAQPRLGGFVTVVGGTRLAEVTDDALVSVACPLQGDAALGAALQSAYGLDRPQGTRSTSAGAISALPLTADQMLLVLADDPAPAADKRVASALQGAGYVTDQTDTWVMVELSGPLARPVLERLCPLDTDPDAFLVGDAARTVMEHMGVLLWRTGPETYRLLSASSSAESFRHALELSLDYVA